jgi:hypothetical protein
LDAAGLVDVQGRVRALVLELARPAAWAPVARVWNGVQSDLGLPAPAIAVSGTDGFQLWFSLSEPVALASAKTFVQALTHRYLQGVAPHRIRCLPQAPGMSEPVRDASTPALTTALAATEPLVMPGTQTAAEQWSAFLAPDLAPLFAETPWLDLPPADDGQAQLLAGLASIPPAAFAEALLRLAQAAEPAPGTRAAQASAPPSTPAPASVLEGSAQRFLLDVMNDEAAPLALRIEAAKALLPYSVSERVPDRLLDQTPDRR